MTLAEELAEMATTLRRTEGHGVRLTAAGILKMAASLERIAKTVAALEQQQRRPNVVSMAAWKRNAPHEQ